MARRRFFVEDVRNGQAEISGDDAQHLTRVLRVEPGQTYEISDNHRVWLAEVELARKQQVVFAVRQELEAVLPPVRVILLAALIKFDHFEWTIEKATELGVERIVPVIAARSEHGLDRAAGKRLPRWRKIALEASQQSRRAFLPEIADPVPMRRAIAEPAGHRYLLDEAPGHPLAAELPDSRTAEDRVALLVGPEGGWTEEERGACREAGWKPVSLGPFILRAETAAAAALAVVTAAWLAAGKGATAPGEQPRPAV